VLLSTLSGTSDNVLTALWETNTDTKTYHLHGFGYAYDLEILERSGRLEGAVLGAR
jgi:hypothetical protein